MNFKKCAFTLAEVLITLTIIGVVAAMTIPVVSAKVKQHEYKTAAKKYNCSFLSLETAITPSKYDGLHFDNREQVKIADAVYKQIAKM